MNCKWKTIDCVHSLDAKLRCQGSTARSTILTMAKNNKQMEQATTIPAQAVGKRNKTTSLRIYISGITLAAAAAHIHVGAPTTTGGIVVGLAAPDANGVSSGCVSADADLIKAIRQNPGDYYVNVHTSDFPAGALRGQLTK